MILISRDDDSDIPWQTTGGGTVPPTMGVIPNFVNPPSLAQWDILTQAVCLTITTLLVAMRTYTKFKVVRNPGWDDFTSFLAWLGLLSIAVLNLKADQYGNGRHLWDILVPNFVVYSKLLFMAGIFYSPTILLAKLSILLLYLRVFRPVHRTYIALHVFLWVNFTFYLVWISLETFQCMPMQKAWMPWVPGHCIDQHVARIASGTFNTVSDFVILAMPVAHVLNLRLYQKGRVGLIAIFGIGLCGCIASLARLALSNCTSDNVNGTWTLYSLSLATVAEITCCIICGCLPSLPAFIRHISGFQVKIIISNSDSTAYLHHHSRSTNESTPHNRSHPSLPMTLRASKSNTHEFPFPTQRSLHPLPLPPPFSAHRSPPLSPLPSQPPLTSIATTNTLPPYPTPAPLAVRRTPSNVRSLAFAQQTSAQQTVWEQQRAQPQLQDDERPWEHLDHSSPSSSPHYDDEDRSRAWEENLGDLDSPTAEERRRWTRRKPSLARDGRAWEELDDLEYLTGDAGRAFQETELARERGSGRESLGRVEEVEEERVDL